MALAGLMRGHRLELRADFQQYYGLDLYGITARHAADLAVMLPRGSRTMRAVNPSNEWSTTEHLLSLIEFWLHVLVWRETKDAKYKRNVPQQITPQKPKKKQQEAEFTAPVEEYAALLARPRKEVRSGN